MTKRNSSGSDRRSSSRSHRSRQQRTSSRRNSNRYQSRDRESDVGQLKNIWVIGGAVGFLLIMLVGWFIFRSIAHEESKANVILPTSMAVAGNVLVTVETVALLPTETEISATITSTTEVTVAVPAPTELQYPAPNFTDLQQQMYRLINEDRAAAGGSQLNWDTTAARAGQRHVEDMIQFNYFSHWNRDGFGPEHRYAQIGGQHAVMENLHTFEYVYEDGRGAPIEDWESVVENAQTGLMNSAGHRVNILDPAHTHVGIGMAYNPEIGQFRLSQEFTNQYVQLIQPIPVQAVLGQEIRVNGRISSNNINNILLDLSYEPFPESVSIEELDATSTYSSVVESIHTIVVSVEFDERILIDENGYPGFYHIRIFGDLPTGQALLMDRIITVR